MWRRGFASLSTSPRTRRDSSLSSLHIKTVAASGYGREGVTIIASGAGSSISYVKIERSSFHYKLWGGVNFTGASPVNRDIFVDHVSVYDCPGIQTSGFVT